jgi:outer membrane protein TolC
MRKIFLYSLLLTCFAAGAVSAQRNLTLEESKQLALQNNSSGKNSRLEIEASRQLKKSVFTKFFPDISAGGIIMRANEPLAEIESAGGDLPVYDGNLDNLESATQWAYFPSSTIGIMEKGTFGFVNAIQPVFTGGRIYNGYKLAGLGEEVSVLKEKLAKDEINLKTEEQYWQLASLQEKRKTILKYEEMLTRLLAQVEDAYKSGLVMKNDVLKVRLKLSEVQLNKSKLENGIKLAGMAFCQYIGIEYSSELLLSDELKITGLPESFYADKNNALQLRAEYNLLQKSVEAEELQTKLKIGEYLPQAAVGLSGVYMKMDNAEDRAVGMVFGTVQIPISGWWGGSHELEERSIKEEIVQNNFKNNSELLLLQIEKSWQDLTDSYKQYLLSEESYLQAEENMNVNNDSYNNGLINVSDLLEAQALLQQAKDQLTEAKADYLVKTTVYLQSTGR